MQYCFRTIVSLRVIKLLLLTLFSVFLFSSSPPSSYAQQCDAIVKPGTNNPLQAAISNINPSANSPKTICVNPGVYNETITVSKSYLTIKASNPENKPIISGNNYTLPLCDGKCQTKDGLSWRYGGFFVVNQADHVTIKDLEITQSQSFGLIFINSDYSQAINNYVHSHRLQGITFQNSVGNLAQNNTVEANSNINQFSRGGGAGLRFCGVKNGTMRSNISRYNWGEGIVIDCNIGRSTNNLVEKNVIHDNTNSYYYFHASQATTFRNNLLFYSHTNPYDPKANMEKYRTWACIWVQAQEDQSYNLSGNEVYGDKNSKIYNNIFFGCNNMINLVTQAPGAYIENMDIYHNTFINIGKSPSTTENKTYNDIILNLSDDGNALPDVGAGRRINNVNIKNNIFYWNSDNNQKEIILARNNNQTPAIDFSHNIWSGNPSLQGFNFSNDKKMTNAKLNGMDGKGNFPIFSNNKVPEKDISYDEIKSWFTLLPDSPAIDAAVPVTINSNIIPTDFFDSNLSNTSRNDIGAHEFGGTPTISPIPSPTGTDEITVIDFDNDLDSDWLDFNRFRNRFTSDRIRFDLNGNDAIEIFDFSLLVRSMFQ